MIVGAQYYRPPNPPPEDWARDLHRMREHGLTTVKLWACWSWMNPSPAVVDFADLDTLMDLAAEAHLTVVINVILEDAPYWLDERHPSARYTDQEGRAVRLGSAMNTPGGGWPGLCFDEEQVWSAAAEFLGAVVRRYSGHPALHSWDVWNEPHLEPASYFPDRMFCYCASSLDAFARWLLGRYGSLESLNDAWARRFSDWTQVQPPRLFEAVPDLLDWRGFWFDNLATWLRRRVMVVRQADDHHPVMTHVALSGFTGQLATHTLDESALAEDVDVFGTSSFPTWLMGDDPVEHLFNLDTARAAAAGKPFWQAELQGGRGRRLGRASTGHPEPAMQQLWMWNALAAGAAGVMFWQWRPELLGPESPGYGLCAPDGGPTPRTRAVGEMSQLLAHPVIGSFVPRPGATGLLLSRGSALHAFATDRTMDLYRDAVLGAYRILVDSGAEVTTLYADRVARDGVPGHVQRVYWPMPTTSSDELGAALAAFADRGGILVAEAAPGEYTPTGWRRATVPPDELAVLFGVRQVEADACEPCPVRLTGDLQLHGDWQREHLRLETADAEGWFADGAAAVTTHRHGTGVARLVATYPSLGQAHDSTSSTRAAVSHLLDLEPVSATGWTWDAPGPAVLIRAGSLPDGRDAWVVVNWTGAPVDGRADVPATAVSLAQGRVVVEQRCQRLRLAGRSGALLIAPAGSDLARSRS